MTASHRSTAPRLKPLACAAIAACAQCPAWADSGNGVDTQAGNALNPAGISSVRPKDPEGLGISVHSRSPTGLLVFDPWLPPDSVDLGGGWRTSGGVEFGGLKVTGDKNAAKFREYKSVQSGLYLNNAWIQAEKPDEALYAEAYGGALGRNDGYLSLTAGRYNAWRVKAFYSEIDHVYTTTYRNLWSGSGSDRLTLNNLPAGPVAPATAASVDIAIGNAALATPYSALHVLRQKGGIRLDLTLPADWKAYASFSSEQRKGARPFGLVSGGGGGTGGIETNESVNYDTHDVLAGVQWSNAATSVNAQVSASLFRNNVGTMTVDNPMFLPAANNIASFPQARFDLYPDNDFFNVKAEAAHAIPSFFNTRFTGVLSFSTSRQNDALIPSTPYPGAVVNGVAGGAWDSTDSLSRTKSGARIDSTLIDLGLVMNPLAALELRGKLRHLATDNKTEYFACNPRTGQWGRLINDGSAAVFATPNTTPGNNPAGTSLAAYDATGCNLGALEALNLVPSAGNVNIRNVPYENTSDSAVASADWRFARSQNASLAYEHERIEREHRERKRTWEDKVKLGYVNRALPGGTMRASFELARRRGSQYEPDPYDDVYSSSFGPLPTAPTTNATSWIHVNDLHRKFDLADRDSAALNLRFNHALADDLDVSVAAQAKDQRYPDSAYGRRGHQRLNSLNADLNWQPTERTSVYGFGSLQRGRVTQAGLQQNACVLGTTYYLYSDGSQATTATPTPAQVAAGITVVGNSGVVTGANFIGLCGHASDVSPLYPTSRTWTANTDDRNIMGGIGWKQDFGRVLLDLNASHTEGRTRIRYSYNAAALGIVNSGAPTPAQLTALALIGDGFPDMKFRQQTVDASLLLPVSRTMAVRLLLRHERGHIRDWHYDGVAENPTPSNNQQTYLDSGPQDWHTTVLGAMLQLSW